MTFQYKCIELPIAMSLDRHGSAADVVRSIESAINNGADGGWEYVGTESVTSMQNAGCISALMGKGQITSTIRVMIFRKEI
jgi:hypothetical protein